MSGPSLPEEIPEQSDDVLYCSTCDRYCDIADLQPGQFVGTCYGIRHPCPICGNSTAEFVPKNDIYQQ
jgi:hypothetical protein